MVLASVVIVALGESTVMNVVAPMQQDEAFRLLA